jgi:hypothetical protein
MGRKRLSVDELRVETFTASSEAAESFRDAEGWSTTYCVATGIDSTCRCCSTGCDG